MRTANVGERGEFHLPRKTSLIFGLNHPAQELHTLHSFSPMTPLVNAWLEQIRNALQNIQFAVESAPIITDISADVPNLPPDFLNLWITVQGQVQVLGGLIPTEFVESMKCLKKLQVHVHNYYALINRDKVAQVISQFLAAITQDLTETKFIVLSNN
jgi:hypothetical protein